MISKKLKMRKQVEDEKMEQIRDSIFLMDEDDAYDWLEKRGFGYSDSRIIIQWVQPKAPVKGLNWDMHRRFVLTLQNIEKLAQAVRDAQASLDNEDFEEGMELLERSISIEKILVQHDVTYLKSAAEKWIAKKQ